MNFRYLRRGDVIYVPVGLNVVYEQFPLCLHHKSFSTYCRQVTSASVKAGHEYHNRTDATIERDQVTERIRAVFTELEIPLSAEILDRFVRHQVRDVQPFTLVVPQGHYVVINVKEHEGTRYVYCRERFGDPGFEMYFWQRAWGPLSHDGIQPVGWLSEDEI